MVSRIIKSTILACLIVACSFGLRLQGNEIYFPSGDEWETVEPESVGWDRKGLDKALDFAMERKSSSVVVLHRGRILAQRHVEIARAGRYGAMVTGRTSSGNAIEDVASCQKSIVSFLVGVAIEKELVELKQPVHQYLGKGWSNASAEQEEKITLQHLLSMTSGLNTRLNFEQAAGKKWRYNTNAYAKSLHCLESASGLTANELTQAWLTERIGMQDSEWTPRPWQKNTGADANSRGFSTSALDLARFGLLILAQGRWKDVPLLREREYLQKSLSSSQTLNPSYGLLWWLNGKSFAIRGAKMTKGPLLTDAPDDLVAALGALGRKCYVVPSEQLVVVRLGDNPQGSLGASNFDANFWKLLMQAKN
ncbi:MAG: serine hydrolase [Planctomycetota bacterium]